MSQPTVEARFESARKRLSHALKELEEVAKAKLHEAANQQIRIVGDEDSIDLGGRVSLPAFNLSQQVNQLQNELVEVGNEVEFQREKNRILLEKLENLQQEKLHLVAAIEENIEAIEQLIGSENKGEEKDGR